MKNLTTAFLAFLLLSSFMGFEALGMAARRPKPKAPAQVELPVMVDPGHITVTTNVTANVARAMRITRLTDAVRYIINSEKFKARVLGAHYKGKPQFHDTLLSNEQVYQKLREGAELKSPADYNWNLVIKTETLGKNVLGRTLTNVEWFSFNDRSIDNRKDSGLVGTICHEYSHKLGFGHSVYSNAARPYSVPYAIGTIAAEVYTELENEGIP